MSELIAFLIVIGVLVFIHELGHFLAARLTGMRADVFAVGMGPRMLGWNKVNGFTFGPLPKDIVLGEHTDYRISWLPIGGYVKIIGMIDESLDTDFAAKPPEPYEFRSKNALQKTLVLSAGVIMNILLAIAIFWVLPLVTGTDEMKVTSVGYVEPGTLAEKMQLERGDTFVSIDGQTPHSWGHVMELLALESQTGTRKIVLNRNGTLINRSVSAADVMRGMTNNTLGLHPSQTRVVLGDVVSYGPADKAGLKKGDMILAADSVGIGAMAQLQRYIRNHAGKSVVLHVERADSVRPVTVQVAKDSVIKVGLEQKFIGPREHKTYGVFEALTLSVAEVSKTVNLIVTSVGHVISGTVSVKQSFGGPVKIAKMASRSQELGMEPFLRFMALISISLAVMNILPLPGLDGGHLLFVLIEAIMRREIPTKVKIRVQQIGMILLLILMAFVFYLDLS